MKTAQEVIQSLPVNAASSKKELYEYAVRRKIAVSSSDRWNVILRKIQEIEVRRAGL